MQTTLTIPKSTNDNQTKTRNPSFAVNADTMANFNGNATIDLTKFLQCSSQVPKQNWLGKLHEKPVLELITDSIPDKEFTPINPTELNCYQRLKKLLTIQSGRSFGQKQSQEDQKLLEGVAVLQDKINKMENNYRQVALKKTSKGNKYIRSYVTSKNNSIHEKQSGFSTSLNSTLQSFAIASKTPELTRKSVKSPKSRISFTPTMKEQVTQFRKACCEKFINHKKGLIQQVYDDVQNFIQTKIEKKMEEVVHCQFGELEATHQKNQQFKMTLLEKQLEIQMLKSQLKIKEERIMFFESKQEPQLQTTAHRRNVQQFYEEYEQTFGDISLNQLRKKLDTMQNIYFNKYSSNEARHLQACSVLKRQKIQIEKASRQQLQAFKARQKELTSMITQIRRNQMLDNSEETHQVFNKINEYKIKCEELKLLQNYIFNKYIEWMGSRNETQNKVIKILHGPKSENYEQMIDSMVDFKQQFEGKKPMEYTTKLLSAIQKLKKVISPSKSHQKLQPFKVIDQIESMLKNPKKRRQKQLRTYQRLKNEQTQQFFEVQQ